MFELNLILYLGLALVLGFLLGKATHWLKLTAIIGYIIAGIILGPVTHIITNEDMLSSTAINIIVDVTLGIIGFIIGVGFTKGFLRRFGKMSIAMAIIESTVTLAMVMLGVYILTRDINLCLILGVIGLATAPAGTIAAIHACRGRGNLSRMTMAIVGIDDGIAIIYFVLILAVVKVLMGGTLSAQELVVVVLIEIGGAIVIGILLGVALIYIAKLFSHREDIFIVALSFIFISIGICELIHASFILACMVIGIIFINMKPRMAKTTHATIETIIPPIFILFFGIAGLELSMKFEHLIEFGIISTMSVIIIYIIFRTLGKLAGATLAGKSMKAPFKIQKYLGFALLSQAGVAIGLVILVSSELGESIGDAGVALGALAITIITITTIIFEIIGPIGVRYALTKAGEAHDV